MALFARVLALAEDVSPVVNARLTHRDLYLDNLLAGPDGSLVNVVADGRREGNHAFADSARDRLNQILD